MRKGFEYFDKVFVINLDIRKDRLKRRYEFFESQGISDLVERYAATRPNEKEYPRKRHLSIANWGKP